MDKKEIERCVKAFPTVRVDIDDFAQNLTESYIHTLYNQVENEHGIRENFCTVNDDILRSIALSLAIILGGLESTSNKPVDLKEVLIGYINEYYIPDENKYGWSNEEA